MRTLAFAQSIAVAVFVSLLAAAPVARGDTIYAAGGANGIDGSLYTLDPTTGAATLVGALLDGSGNTYGLTGMSFEPGTGVLYGIVGNNGTARAALLVTVDPTTALVTPIGALGNVMSDISFQSDGTLYAWRAGFGTFAHLQTINLLTGLATPVPGGPATSLGGGGSLAFSPTGTLFTTPDSAPDNPPPGTLRTVNPLDGVDTIVANLSGAPLVIRSGGMVINASDFDSTGVLYGINSNGFDSRSGQSYLVTINTTNAAITSIGDTGILNLDALAIQRSASPIPEPSSLALLGTGAASGFVCLLLRRRRSRRMVT